MSARTKEDAIVLLDEWDDAEEAEIVTIRDFMIDFRLNDEGELELKEFGEGCRDAILEKAYPRLAKALRTAPLTKSAEENDQRIAMLRVAVAEERARPIKSTRATRPATEAAKELQRRLGASAAYANRAVKATASDLLDKVPTTARKQ